MTGNAGMVEQSIKTWPVVGITVAPIALLMLAMSWLPYVNEYGCGARMVPQLIMLLVSAACRC